MFCIFCVCGFVVPTFCVSLDVFIFLCLWLSFANVICFLTAIFFSFASVAWFCQFSMSLYYVFFRFFCVYVFILSMLYDSLNVFFFSFSFFLQR